jgi:hypothetical protein
MEEAQGVKPFNYDSVFRENNELKKQHTLLLVKLKALSMEEKDAYMWWDVMQDIVQKYIRKVCRRHEKNERLYRHRISHMENVATPLWPSVRMKLTLPKLGIWSLPGLPNV